MGLFLVSYHPYYNTSENIRISNFACYFIVQTHKATKLSVQSAGNDIAITSKSYFKLNEYSPLCVDGIGFPKFDHLL